MKTKKELVAEYRERKAPMGVFQIRNTVNAKVFLDASVDMPARWNRHRFQLDFGNHPNQELQADWRSMGPDAFVYEVVEELVPKRSEVPQDQLDHRAEVDALLELCLEERRSLGAFSYQKENSR